MCKNSCVLYCNLYSYMSIIYLTRNFIVILSIVTVRILIIICPVKTPLSLKKKLWPRIGHEKLSTIWTMISIVSFKLFNSFVSNMRTISFSCKEHTFHRSILLILRKIIQMITVLQRIIVGRWNVKNEEGPQL